MVFQDKTGLSRPRFLQECAGGRQTGETTADDDKIVCFSGVDRSTQYPVNLFVTYQVGGAGGTFCVAVCAGVIANTGIAVPGVNRLCVMPCSFITRPGHRRVGRRHAQQHGAGTDQSPLDEVTAGNIAVIFPHLQPPV